MDCMVVISSERCVLTGCLMQIIIDTCDMKAWEKCTTKEWNLSEEVITSRKATAALRRYLATDEILRKEIEEKIGPLPPSATDIELQNDKSKEADDSDVPSSRVIKDVLGIDILSADDHGRYCVTDGDVALKEHSTHLHANGGSEDVWADEEDDGMDSDGDHSDDME